MYIDFEKIGETLSLFIPYKYKHGVRDVFYKLKIWRNCCYIEKNAKKVIQRLRKEVKTRKLRVAFLCVNAAKWKTQSLYDLMLKSDIFHPYILVTRENSEAHYPFSESKKLIKDVYNFFKSKNMEVYSCYDTENNKFIPIEKFEPDIIFYQHPYYNHTQQGPVFTSKFALTYYVPYFISNLDHYSEYNLRFHRYIHKYFLLNKEVADYYRKKADSKGKNYVVSGHTILDYFYLNDIDKEGKKYVIFAPHWSINHEAEYFATFEWNGQFILDFAKQHPEIDWIFKPHPTLKQRLKNQKIMTEKEIENYWKEWEKIGKVYEQGDYLDLFAKSKAMITDCGSFLTEFFLTKQPLIMLISDRRKPSVSNVEKITDTYYKAHNLTELETLLNKVIINNFDDMKEKRLAMLKALNLEGVYAAQNIFDYIRKELNG